MKTFPGIIVGQHRTDRKQMGLLRGQFAKLRKGLLLYGCNQVWMKNGGRIPWNVTAFCEAFKISCLMRRHLMRGVSEHHSKARLFRLEQWQNITQFRPKTCRDCISSAQKSCQVNFLDMRYTLAESGKETSWSRTLRNWRRWTHLKSLQEDSMQRKC